MTRSFSTDSYPNCLLPLKIVLLQLHILHSISYHSYSPLFTSYSFWSPLSQVSEFYSLFHYFCIPPSPSLLYRSGTLSPSGSNQKHGRYPCLLPLISLYYIIKQSSDHSLFKQFPYFSTSLFLWMPPFQSKLLLSVKELWQQPLTFTSLPYSTLLGDLKTVKLIMFLFLNIPALLNYGWGKPLDQALFTPLGFITVPMFMSLPY